ncbi:MAG: hypothetical protein NT094_01210 [Candidatus Staskawiczbacteria bacterium]|nr:hypothetical protein [Candidatus Staskawiczbacteria bacterium]
MLTDKHISNFLKIYKEQFGVDISREEAQKQAVQLLQLVKTVYQPITLEEYENIEAQIKNY